MGVCEFDPTGRFMCVHGRTGDHDEVMFARLPEPDPRPVEELIKATRRLTGEE